MNDFDIAYLERFGAAPVFVFCDHASNAMPDDMNCLGLPEDILKTHIAYDIGASALAAALALRLKGTFFRSGFSRLVVDPNRPVTSHDLIPATSDQIPIPGNQMLSEADRKARIERFHVPYHDRLDEALDETIAQSGPPFVISIHSFTNRLMGAKEDRPWALGLLWREDEPSARGMINYLEQHTEWRIGDNEPYDAREFNYSVDRHIGPRSLSHLTIEARQDLIADAAGVDTIADVLSEGVIALSR
ncbi:N-formylglutamate amidohydrolase [Hyphococcus sp.]|jgi:predicted N-formylglutamate amidohydrolase|uniref:N-formylglutamate amidohydrolase n=1 Tax=Hyphococcus sp. TaxID=2038636 RepID=UPI003D0DDC36